MNRRKTTLYNEILEDNRTEEQLRSAKRKIRELEAELAKERKLNAIYQRMFEERKETI